MNEIVFGDCRVSMRKMVADGVRAQMCVTSPPYFGLRDYGTATWEGGRPDCDHRKVSPGTVSFAKSTLGPNRDGVSGQKTNGHQQEGFRSFCGKCGARRVDAQLGLEETPEQYVMAMVETFRLVRDVIADDGTLWLNLGDSYAANRSYRVCSTKGGAKHGPGQSVGGKGSKVPAGLKPKDLIGIPWRVAFALQADGWYLRQDIIWNKPNAMPESIRDRCGKSHEYLFLLAKSEKYYFDMDAIKEDATNAGKVIVLGEKSFSKRQADGAGVSASGNGLAQTYTVPVKRNKRSVWTVTTKPYKGAHFATFPADLIEPCVLAGSRVGDVVFDPFMGSGTTAQVALQHGRQYLGCELNADYKDLQDRRIASVGPPEMAEQAA